MSETADWLAEHQGNYLYTWGRVWECGDDDCGCTEAQIVSFYQNKVVPMARIPIVDWSGEFHTDHEAGADDELAEYRRALRLTDPEREAAIKWQQGVDYGA